MSSPISAARPARRRRKASPRRGGNRRPEILARQAAKSAPTASAADIFRLLREGARAGRRGVLATITGLTGTGARAVGTHMGVLESGESAGSFSSGCVEAAIVAEAQQVLDTGKPRSVRFGQGSPYIDIRLPCGGGMDVLFLPDPQAELLEQVSRRFEDRRPFALILDESGGAAVAAEADRPTGWREGRFAVRHVPPLRLVLLGQGAEMLAGLHLGHALGLAVELVSPDPDIVETASAFGARAERLSSAARPPILGGDPWTAFLFLFHDHDWEPALLIAALREPCFWIGAMGSRRTHAARRAALAAAGASSADIDRIRGPVGLIPSSRDPSTLALSAIAEIVAAYGAAAG